MHICIYTLQESFNSERTPHRRCSTRGKESKKTNTSHLLKSMLKCNPNQRCYHPPRLKRLHLWRFGGFVGLDGQQLNRSIVRSDRQVMGALAKSQCFHVAPDAGVSQHGPEIQTISTSVNFLTNAIKYHISYPDY